MNERDDSRQTAEDGDRVGDIIRAAGRRPAPSATDYADVLAISHGAWRRKVRAVRRRRFAYAAAASIVAAVIAGVGMQTLRTDASVAVAGVVQGPTEVMLPGTRDWRPLDIADDELFPGTRLRTLANSRASFDLSRGASLRLDSGTTILLESDSRISLDSGALYLDSGLGVRTAQYEVVTALGTVRDIGTQFEVASVGGSLRVRVREGRVELDRVDGGEQISGLAGQQFTLSGTGAVARADLAPDDPAWAWTEHLAPAQQIDDRSAFDILSWVARETGRQLRFEDAAAESLARNSSLSGGGQSLSPSEALDVATRLADLDWRIDDGVIWISTR